MSSYLHDNFKRPTCRLCYGCWAESSAVALLAPERRVNPCFEKYNWSIPLIMKICAFVFSFCGEYDKKDKRLKVVYLVTSSWKKTIEHVHRVVTRTLQNKPEIGKHGKNNYWSFSNRVNHDTRRFGSLTHCNGNIKESKKCEIVVASDGEDVDNWLQMVIIMTMTMITIMMMMSPTCHQNCQEGRAGRTHCTSVQALAGRQGPALKTYYK